MAPRENRLIRQPVTLEIAGSSPAGVAREESYIRSEWVTK